MKYLVVECRELGDQWECDADRTPILVTDDYSDYNSYGYEIYQIEPDGKLKLIREYDSVTDEGFCYCFYDKEDVEEGYPTKVEKFKKKFTRDTITNSQVKKWKSAYKLKGTVEEIISSIHCSGDYSEETEDGGLKVIGEYLDDNYPLGY